MHDVETILENAATKETLAKADLSPSSWKLPNLEMTRMTSIQLKLEVIHDLPRKNWPACVDLNDRRVKIAQDFLNLRSFTREEKLATIVHEIGHIVNPEPADRLDGSKAEAERVASYLDDLKRQENPQTAPAGIGEFFADDYARHCGLTNPLRAALQRLRTDYPDFFNTQATCDRLSRIDSGSDPELNLFESPA
jgi:hypothetical protein